MAQNPPPVGQFVPFIGADPPDPPMGTGIPPGYVQPGPPFVGNVSVGLAAPGFLYGPTPVLAPPPMMPVVPAPNVISAGSIVC
ncbi:MAG TPA: hypothetical protein VM243_08620 [Phycisphaerae bacterium]|nr:hypothetical protein [Phycisphaerae bacterium]